MLQVKKVDLPTMNSVLITGASGFVGGHLVQTLSAEGFAVVAITGSKPCPPQVRARAVDSQSLDLTDSAATAAMLSRFKPQAVIHCAALAQGGACEIDPGRAAAINVGGTAHLLAATAQLSPAPLVIYLSTDLVFDGNSAKTAPFGESDRPTPQSAYAKSKRDGELLCLAASVPALIARVSLVYGPTIAGNHGALGWMIDTLRRGDSLTLFTDEFRTPIYAPNIGTTLAKVIRRASSGLALPSLLHIPGPERCSRYEFGASLAAALGLSNPRLQTKMRAEIRSVPPRPEDTSLRCDYPDLLALPFQGYASGLLSSVSA